MIQDLRVNAFVGTLWEVNDVLAADFSIAFENLQSGQKLAEAFHNARLAIKRNHPDNSTWLAYTLYGGRSECTN